MTSADTSADALPARALQRSGGFHAQAPGAGQNWFGVVAPMAALVGIVIWLFWPWFSTQLRWAFEQQADWGHTMLVPFISGYFVYLNRKKLLQSGFVTTWWALLPMLAGIGMYFLSIGHRALQHHNIQGFGVWLTIASIVLLFCGWRSMKWLAFPLIYLLVFGQTISERVLNLATFQMQDITARGAHLVMMPFMEVDRSGNTLYIFDDGVSKPLNIAEACSGMRMLMAFLALGCAMAYTGLKRNWQRITLVMLAIPVAIFVNILRVVTLAILSLFDSEFAAGDFHSFIGLVWLVPAFFIFLGCVWVIAKLVVEGEAGEEQGTTSEENPALGTRNSVRALFDYRSRAAFVIACMALIGGGFGIRYAVHALNIYLRKEPVYLRGQLATIPRTLGRWKAITADAVLDSAQVEELGTPFYFDRFYAVGGAEGVAPMNVHLAYYTGMIDTVPHVPDRCLAAAGYRIVVQPSNEKLAIDRLGWFDDPEFTNLRTGKPYSVVQFRDDFTGEVRDVRMPTGEFTLRLTQFEHEKRPGIPVFGGYFFIANGAVMGTPEEVRLLAFDPREKHAYYCKVQFVYYQPGATREQFLEYVAEILKALLPEVMQRLPDWAEIERLSPVKSSQETFTQ